MATSRDELLARIAHGMGQRAERIDHLIRSISDRAVESGVYGVRVVYWSDGDVVVMLDAHTPFGWITEERRT